MIHSFFDGVVILLLLGLMMPVKPSAAPETNSPPARKAFDFVVGVDGNFKEALTAAKAASGKRFLMFFPRGNYPIGTLTGDGNQMTTVTASNLSLIGEDMDSTIISNKPANEGISITATLFFSKANNCYLQDLTVLNDGNYHDPNAANVTGRFAAIQDQGDKNIFRHVKLLSKQDTYYSQSSRTYWEDGEIHGFVDFICGYGDIFFSRCLLYLEQRSTVVITAPATKTSWGYVFMDCTIDGAAGDGYRLGRSWSNQPKCVFINTIMKKVPNAAGWGDPMNVVPSLFAEYNSKTASGSAVNLSSRRTSYTMNGTTVTLNPVLTSEQAAKYTAENVLKGSDNWQPWSDTRQISVSGVRRDGERLVWDDDDSARCWMVFKDGKYFKCVTTPGCDIATAAGASYSVRAANAMGGLGPAAKPEGTAVRRSDALQPRGPEAVVSFDRCRRTLRVEARPAEELRTNIYSVDGKCMRSKCVSAGAAAIPLGGFAAGLYIVKTESAGISRTGFVEVF